MRENQWRMNRFSVFMRSIADYVTNEKKRKTDRKEVQKKLNKKLFEENSNRRFVPFIDIISLILDIIQPLLYNNPLSLYFLGDTSYRTHL